MKTNRSPDANLAGKPSTQKLTMPHQPELIEKFIELRAQTQTLIAISETLSVPLSTVGAWNKRFAGRIAERRAVLWENAEHNCELGVKADFVRLAERILACEAELARRPVGRFSTNQLLRLLAFSRREYFRRRDPLLAAFERPDRALASSVAGEADDNSANPAANTNATAQTCDSQNASPPPQQDFKGDPSAANVASETPPSRASEPIGNISNFPITPPAPQRLATTENEISNSDAPGRVAAPPATAPPVPTSHGSVTRLSRG